MLGMQTHTQKTKQKNPVASMPETLITLHANPVVATETARRWVVMEICQGDQWAGERVVVVVSTDTE